MNRELAVPSIATINWALAKKGVDPFAGFVRELAEIADRAPRPKKSKRSTRDAKYRGLEPLVDLYSSLPKADRLRVKNSLQDSRRRAVQGLWLRPKRQLHRAVRGVPSLIRRVGRKSSSSGCLFRLVCFSAFQISPTASCARCGAGRCWGAGAFALLRTSAR